ncbi:hypothetical protein FKW77_008702 [Venturia effusa]|uniref:C2H2-type domain-containing protein n=1 Tax=Venturia effusa TaxID=50376 RepID=A0A517L7W8_9PEZI|nr:hypothetical protein FKW77_008702 [Venturia effusa]
MLPLGGSHGILSTLDDELLLSVLYRITSINPIRTPLATIMLSPKTSSIDQRRKAHRRQNSTPVLEVQQNTNPRPFPAPIQRPSGPSRGHRRGLSLDQHMTFHRQGRMTPTLGPITQDDTQVQLTYTGQQQPQHPLQVAQQHSMAQPGPPHFQYPPRHQPNLSPETSQVQHQHDPHPSAPAFEFPSHQQFHRDIQSDPQPNTPIFEFPQQSQPLQPPESPHQTRFTSSPQIPQHSQCHQDQQLQGPCDEAVRKLKESVEAVYGPGSNVFINILPTPIATPQKRASQAPMSQIDPAPIPLDFGAADNLGLEPSNSNHGFEFHNSPEGSYYSPVGNSPDNSSWHSPVQQPMGTYLEPPPHLSFDDHPLLSHAHFSSSQTTLADVEPMYSPSHGGYSPDRSPRQLSVAELNLDATIVDTNISSEEVAALIEHDTTTNTFRCLFDGCNKAGFQRRENVRSHVQTHLGDRPYMCIHCKKTFVRPHDLKRHAKIHSGVKPYQCPCGQEFVRQDALTRHRQRGSCSGAFPDAIPKTPARRGRPRKNRPELEKRVDKAVRTRRMNAARGCKMDDYSGHSSSGGSGSDSENSPSPQPETETLDFGTLETSGGLGSLENSQPQNSDQNESTEPFSFNNFSASSPCDDYSSPFDQVASAEDMFFQLSASSSSNNNNNNPTPPDSPSGGEPLIMDPMSLVSSADDLFFGTATDLKVESSAFENSAFWLE